MFRYTCWILIKVTCGNQERFLVCVPISNTLRNLQHNEENCVCDFIFLLVEGSHVFESPFYRDLISVSVTCMCFRSALCTYGSSSPAHLHVYLRRSDVYVHFQHLNIALYIQEGQMFHVHFIEISVTGICLVVLTLVMWGGELCGWFDSLLGQVVQMPPSLV